MDNGADIQEEARRLNDRFFAGVLLYISTRICKRAAGLDVSDQNPATTMNGHVAFYWASMLNEMAELSFISLIISFSVVMFRTALAPVRMRRLREDSDVKLVAGSFCLVISLFFLAYFHCFVVG